MLIGDNVSPTEHKKILKAQEDFLDDEELNEHLELLKKAESLNDVTLFFVILQKAIAGFVPEKDIVDVVYLERKH